MEGVLQTVRLLRLGLLIGGLAWSAGCASMAGVQERYFVCPYDTVWEAAVDTMKDRPVLAKDKGIIETDWMEVEAASRSYGMFNREGFGTRERARLTLTVKRLNDVTSVSLSENRQIWHLRGGATSGATKWWPVDPSEEAMAAILNRLKIKLKEHECSAG